MLKNSNFLFHGLLKSVFKPLTKTFILRQKIVSKFISKLAFVRVRNPNGNKVNKSLLCVIEWNGVLNVEELLYFCS